MEFEKGDLVNFLFQSEKIFIFREEIRVEETRESLNGYRYYSLDRSRLKDLQVGFGWIREDYIFPLSFKPSIDLLALLLLDNNPWIREEASRVYEKFYRFQGYLD